MSGLETAIRNALDRSDRADREIRARIYQSARQALDAGLRKQGVSDRLVIMEQQELLERKIREIETAEIERLAEQEPEPHVELDPPGPVVDAPVVHAPVADTRYEGPAVEPEVSVGSALRPETPAAPSMTAVEGIRREPATDFSDFAATRADRVDAPLPQPPEEAPSGKPAKAAKGKAAKPAKASKKAATGDTSLDVPPERAAKPRKRRSFVSHLMTWFITLAIVGGACWWFYQSGMVQSFIEDAMRTTDQAGGGQTGSQGGTGFDPRRGFSEDWVAIFVPSKLAELKSGAQARVEAVSASEGQAARILSAVPTDGGDVAIDVPVELLREMAGKSSTIALTLQSGENRSTQLSVRCDFGSLGSCSRHRFTATQEKLEALFKVTFDRSLAPNKPGRLILNSGIEGANRPVLLYSVRVLPGQ